MSRVSSAARRRMSLSALVALALLEIARAGAPAAAPAARASPTGGPDPHSYANFDEMRVRHLDLALEVDIESKRLSGAADLTVERLAPAARMLRLDTRDLLVRAAWLVQEDDRLEALEFALGTHDPVLGRELRIELPADAPSPATVRISYQTRPQATGLQWLPPAQTADRSSPFLFSQSQAIHARSWIPLQDSPAVRQTYRATIHAPEGFRALMSGAHAVAMPPDGVFRFDMRQPIPSYLIAIAVGRLEFRAMSERTGVYAEPSVVEAAAREFADTERMLVESEKLFGPYRWERYDLLILPPSFPFGGMENPRLSFITPSVIAGDRSLTGLIAHELAHSWSGNLVTNASWKDLWLNEGFTTFLEARIVEAVYGPRRNAMEKVLGLQALRRDMADLEPRDTRLELVLAGRDPDDAFSEVPYQKGALFLDWLESRVGREAMDAFLKAYFERFAFRSIDTEGFRAYLREELLARHPGRVSEAELDAWIEGPGLPKFAVLPESDAFAKVDRARADFLAGRIGTRELPAAEWTTHEWLHFLDNLPAKLARERLTALDEAFSLTESANSEIAHSWYRIAIRNGYEPAWDELEVYLVRIGRRKLIKPLYEDLMKAPGGAALARRIYARARSGYHPIAVATLDDIVR